MTVIECALKAGGVVLAACAGWMLLSAAIMDLAFRLDALLVEPSEPGPEPRRALR
jgi:glutamine amidotransferase PdxT